MIFRRTLINLLIVGAACLFFAGNGVFAADTSSGKSDHGFSDEWIKTKLVTAYTLNEHLNPFELDVDVDGGVVRLTGQVENGIDRDLAGEIARGLDGVSKVENQIQIKGENTNRKEPSHFYQTVKDATLTARVKSNLLWNQHTDGLKIDVDSSEGMVTLKGNVRSDAEKELAVQIAENTRGVRIVKDKLTVNPALADAEEGLLEKTGKAVKEPLEKTGRVMSDTWITSKVKAVLMFDKRAEGANISVDTKNGVVTLEGTVQSETQKKQVVELTENVVSVKTVVSKLRIL